VYSDNCSLSLFWGLGGLLEAEEVILNYRNVRVSGVRSVRIFLLCVSPYIFVRKARKKERAYLSREVTYYCDL